jgi:hypothetical protein
LITFAATDVPPVAITSASSAIRVAGCGRRIVDPFGRWRIDQNRIF